MCTAFIVSFFFEEANIQIKYSRPRKTKDQTKKKFNFIATDNIKVKLFTGFQY